MVPGNTIFLVDDSRELNDAAARILRASGYNVVQLFDGFECLELLKTRTPDLIMLDIVMPGLSGLDLCRQIKSSPDGKELFIILLSSVSTSADQQAEGLEVGADGYIVRPIQNRELLARVNAAIRIVDTEKELRIALTKSRKLEEELAGINATKDLFFSIIAHDLKNPINTILGFSQALVNDYKDLDSVKIQEILNIIADTSSKATDLLTNLLLWSGSQTGKIVFAPENFRLLKVVSESISPIENQAKLKSIEINLNISDKIYVFADKNMIMTVLRNIISNAVKFTQTGGKILIGATENTFNVEISVADTGIGISEEVIRKLFHIENSITTQGTESEEGTGLGLILCKEFIGKHGGIIWVESEIGKGGRFVFTIPK